MADETPADDDGAKADKAFEICDAVIDRCWDLITEDSVAKKLTPLDLACLMQATERAWRLATGLISSANEETDGNDNADGDEQGP